MLLSQKQRNNELVDFGSEQNYNNNPMGIKEDFQKSIRAEQNQNHSHKERHVGDSSNLISLQLVESESPHSQDKSFDQLRNRLERESLQTIGVVCEDEIIIPEPSRFTISVNNYDLYRNKNSYTRLSPKAKSEETIRIEYKNNYYRDNGYATAFCFRQIHTQKYCLSFDVDSLDQGFEIQLIKNITVGLLRNRGGKISLKGSYSHWKQAQERLWELLQDIRAIGCHHLVTPKKDSRGLVKLKVSTLQECGEEVWLDVSAGEIDVEYVYKCQGAWYTMIDYEGSMSVGSKWLRVQAYRM